VTSSSKIHLFLLDLEADRVPEKGSPVRRRPPMPSRSTNKNRQLKLVHLFRSYDPFFSIGSHPIATFMCGTPWLRQNIANNCCLASNIHVEHLGYD
jgi:hypothetical protein